MKIAILKDDGYDTPLIDCAFTRGVAALANHKPEPEANARNLLMRTEICTQLQPLNICTQEKIFFVIMVTNINLREN